MAALSPGELPPPTGAMRLEVVSLTKRFGTFTALDDVSIRFAPGTVHALLGENGAGKSTLVKCIAGFHQAEGGSVVCDDREQAIANPRQARALGIGMVYQHFTLAPGMTVAENLLLAADPQGVVIRWASERAKLEAFLRTAPFGLALDARPSELAAGEKQKLELLKQLYLKPRLLILDEPTSVLTPQEADEVLGHVREFARAGHCTVLIITHKFREVMAYADAVTVLRRGRAVLTAAVRDTHADELAAAMVGAAQRGSVHAGVTQGTSAAGTASARGGRTGELPPSMPSDRPAPARGAAALEIDALRVIGDRGVPAVDGLNLSVFAGEIVGVAGVSGNGQRELVEAIVGQRARAGGRVRVGDEAYEGRREENRRLKLRCLPEEPLRNACVADLSVAQNMALRDFDLPPYARGGFLNEAAWRERAVRWIADYGIKCRGDGAPIRSLSGGNVQRAVLSRELAGDINVLIAVNPVFGLDFGAVAEIHGRLLDLRSRGGAVLLVSEDLDELLELADRIVVMSEGRLVHETPASQADRRLLGAFMGGHGHEERVA